VWTNHLWAPLETTSQRKNHPLFERRTMTNRQALRVLIKYNAWRRGDDNGFLLNNTDSRQLGIALDAGIKALEQQTKKTKKTKKVKK